MTETDLLEMGIAHAIQVGWAMVALAVILLAVAVALLLFTRRYNGEDADFIRVSAGLVAALIAVGAGVAIYHASTFLSEPMYWAYLWLIRAGR